MSAETKVPTTKVLKCGHEDTVSHLIGSMALMFFAVGGIAGRNPRQIEEQIIKGVELLFAEAGISNVLPESMRAKPEDYEEVTVH